MTNKSKDRATLMARIDTRLIWHKPAGRGARKVDGVLEYALGEPYAVDVRKVGEAFTSLDARSERALQDFVNEFGALAPVPDPDGRTVRASIADLRRQREGFDRVWLAMQSLTDVVAKLLLGDKWEPVQRYLIGVVREYISEPHVKLHFSTDPIEVVAEPVNLLGALWLHVARLIMTGEAPRNCRNADCQNIVVVNYTNGKSLRQLWCKRGQACRQHVFRHPDRDRWPHLKALKGAALAKAYRELPTYTGR
jgi:hypothetical protein